ncbi:MAG: hypothetical protein PUD47_00470 [Bacteroidales bacterium]|nr:hypothetical protein [Bacteroidales bacterium]
MEKNELYYQQRMRQMCHMLSDYILPTPLPLLFLPVLQPAFAARQNEAFYRTYLPLSERCQRATGADKLAAQNQLNQLAKRWQDRFAQLLVEFFRLRLLGSRQSDAYRQRMTAATTLFLDIMGEEADRNDDILDITERFFRLLKEYLVRNLPDLSTSASRPTSEVLRECRRLYDACQQTEGYIPFHQLTYTQGLLALTDEAAASFRQSPMCRYFLIVTEYLYTLFLYVYMVELVQSAQGKPSLLLQLRSDPFSEA